MVEGRGGDRVDAIAADAGVALQTLYSSFGSKAGVVRGLVDLIDEEADVVSLFEAMMASDDPAEALAHFARIRRQIRERCGDIVAVMRAAAPVDADLGAASGRGWMWGGPPTSWPRW